MLHVGSKDIFETPEELVDPKHTALLLIDIQNDYVSPGGYFDRLGTDISRLRQIVPRVKKLLDAARRNGVLVVFVQKTLYRNFIAEEPCSLRSRLRRLGDRETTDYADKLLPYCIDGTWGWQIVEDLTPLPNELTVKKQHSSGFAGSNLDTILSSNQIKSVLIVGVVSNGCVLATATDAPSYGYYPVVVKDCVASHKPALHEAALAIISESKDVLDSSQLLDIWSKAAS